MYLIKSDTGHLKKILEENPKEILYTRVRFFFCYIRETFTTPIYSLRKKYNSRAQHHRAQHGDEMDEQCIFDGPTQSQCSNSR